MALPLTYKQAKFLATNISVEQMLLVCTKDELKTLRQFIRFSENVIRRSEVIQNPALLETDEPTGYSYGPTEREHLVSIRSRYLNLMGMAK